MWDDEIDSAARNITAGEPGGALKARVLARIEQRRLPRAAWWIASLAVTAAIVVSVLVYRGASVQQTQQTQDVQHVQRAREVQPAQDVQTVQDVQRAPEAQSGPRRGAMVLTAADLQRRPSVRSAVLNGPPGGRSTPAMNNAIAVARAVTVLPGSSPDIAAAIEASAPPPLALAPIDITAMPATGPIAIADLSTPPIDVSEIEVSDVAAQ